MFDSESPSVCSLSKCFAVRAVAARSSRCEAPPGQPWWIPAANAAKPLNEESSFPIRSAVWQEAMFDLRVLSGHRWLVWFLEQEDHLQTGPGQIYGKCVMCAIVTCAVPSVIAWCLSCSIITSLKWQPKISFLGVSSIGSCRVTCLCLPTMPCIAVQVPHVVLAKQSENYFAVTWFASEFGHQTAGKCATNAFPYVTFIWCFKDILNSTIPISLFISIRPRPLSYVVLIPMCVWYFSLWLLSIRRPQI